MDENYLDNLLNEFSLDKEIDNKIEDELDEEITSEKRKRRKSNSVLREESFNMDLEQDVDSLDSDIDLNFSEAQIDELDRLDNLADIDIGDMDFSDIDFDDIDITKLEDGISDDFDSLLNDFEGNLEIPDFSFDDKQTDEGRDSVNYEDNDTDSTEEYDADGIENENNLSDNNNDVNNDVSEEQYENTEQQNASFEDSSSVDNSNNLESDNLNVDSFDADSFLDSLLEEEGIDAETGDSGLDSDKNVAASNSNDNQDSLDSLLENEPQPNNNVEFVESEEMQPLSDDDDLFSMLNLDEQQSSDNDEVSNVDNVSNISSEGASGLSELEIEDSDKTVSDGSTDDKPQKKKRTFMEILFGEPDEDDIETEEEIQAREAKKAEKQAKKEAAKAAKADKAEKAKAKKSLDDAKKKKDDAEKKRIKAEKKAKKKAEEAANAEPEKKLNKPMVIFIFSVFLGGAGFLYLSSVDFNYKLAIKQAADYFASQKYHKAYDEIKGVEVKEKDKELKERIYTVMYVERLYESYENNIELGRQKKALDSLLRGVTKYYEYYNEARELDIVSDLDYSFSQIQNALMENYGITVDQAITINELDDYEYMKTIEQYTEGMSEE